MSFSFYLLPSSFLFLTLSLFLFSFGGAPAHLLRAFASHQQLGEAVHVDCAASFFFFFFFLCAIGLPARALASRSTLAV
jgi:hypothetical protein